MTEHEPPESALEVTPQTDPVETKKQDSKIPGMGHSILFMLIFLGIAGAVGVIAAVAELILFLGDNSDTAKDTSAAITTWMAGLGNLLAAALVLKIGLAWSKRSLGEILPFKKFSSILVVPLVLMGVGFSFIMSDVDNLLRYFLPPPDFITEIMAQLTSSGPASFFVLVIVAPLTEEAFFRGLIMNGFRKRYSPAKAIFLTALLFSLFHLNPYQLANAFVLGLVLGWLRLRTASLWPCMLLHAFANGVVILCGHLPVEIPGYNVLVEKGFQPWWFDLTGVILAAGGLFWAWSILRNRAGATR